MRFFQNIFIQINKVFFVKLNFELFDFFLSTENKKSKWQLDRRDIDIKEFIDKIIIEEQQERQTHRIGRRRSHAGTGLFARLQHVR